MSQKPEEQGAIQDMDFSTLDAELARMAEETPEVPEDFHDRWTQAVRAVVPEGSVEAAGSPRGDKNAWAVPEGMVQATAQRRRAAAGRQWRYLAGVAAVFIFLIGGTALTRSQRTLRAPMASTAPAASFSMEADLEAPVSGAAQETEAAILYDGAVDGAAPEGLDNGASMMYAVNAASETADMMEEPEAPMTEEFMAAETEQSVDMEAAMEQAADTTALAAGAARAAAKESAPASEPENAAKASALAEGTEDAMMDHAPLPEPAEPESEEAPMDSAAAAEPEEPTFWQDLGSFTLSTLPWIAGAGIILALLVFLSRRNRKQ